MPTLRWNLSEGRPRAFPIYKKISTIGRGAGNDVAIEDRSVAEFHAQLVFDGRNFAISEVDGHEVRVNGKRKRRAKIYHGDAIQLGEASFTFSVYDEVDAPQDAEPARAAELKGMLKLSEFNRMLMNIASVPEQINALLDAVIEVTHAAKGFVLFLDEGVPKIAASRNLDRQAIPDAVEQLSDSIVQQCIETERPLIVSDALNDTFFGRSASVMNLELCSVMAAPLMAQGQLLGVIYVGNDNVVSLFEESSLDILTIFAAQASLIVQNALLLDALRFEQQEARMHSGIIGSCAPLLEVFETVRKVAPTDVPVLITGETGTGKELIARAIHERSPRKDGPFVVINCGAIPENLMESELFGHVRGAFTGAVTTRQGKFEQAHKGTLFLDEIGEMPLTLQVKLLRALQEHVVTKVGDHKAVAVDIRVLAATHRDLLASIQEGTFREDLYYRLNVVGLELPPLRDRGADVELLAKFFLKRYAAEFDAKVKGFTPAALTALQRFDWPGNVRQLENRVKKAIVLADKILIGPQDLDLGEEAFAPLLPLAAAREEFTRTYIHEVLSRNAGNRTKTARDLGVDPRTIFRYLERDVDEEFESV